jgi:hypothetical protein
MPFTYLPPDHTPSRSLPSSLYYNKQVIFHPQWLKVLLTSDNIVSHRSAIILSEELKMS